MPRPRIVFPVGRYDVPRVTRSGMGRGAERRPPAQRLNRRAKIPGFAAFAAAISAAEWLPLHHWSRGTRALTEAMWLPQPAQVVLLQVRQRTGEHIVEEILLDRG